MAFLSMANRTKTVTGVLLLGIGPVFLCPSLAFADSQGKFPGRGSAEAYNRSCDFVDRGIALAKKGDYAGAVSAEKEAISIYPYDSGAYHDLGNHLEKLGRLDEARKAQEQAVALEPGYVGAWISMGETYEKQRKLADAERCYRKAVQINPSEYGALGSLGDVLRQQGNFVEARKWFVRAKSFESAKYSGQVEHKIEQCDRKEASD